jgi:hypothetical protein
MVTSHFQVCEEYLFDREQESHWRLFILIFVVIVKIKNI